MPENSCYKRVLLIFRILWISLTIFITFYLYRLYTPYMSIPSTIRHLNQTLHRQFKPSGNIGHGLGMIGTLIIFFSYSLYFLRKRVEALEFLGPLSLWLEIHIFLGILGPILIFFHSAYALTGFMGLAFWLMVVIIISGILGRIFFGYCLWGMSRIYEPLHLVDIFIEKDLENDRAISPIVKRIMELRPPGFPVSGGLIKTFKQWKFINKETRELLDLINIKYDDISYRDYEELHQRGDELIKRLRDVRYISLLDLILSLLNKWEFIHITCSYILFGLTFIHIFITAYWGYTWIF